jgi:hypothetical protein
MLVVSDRRHGRQFTPITEAAAWTSSNLISVSFITDHPLYIVDGLCTHDESNCYLVFEVADADHK